MKEPYFKSVRREIVEWEQVKAIPMTQLMVEHEMAKNPIHLTIHNREGKLQLGNTLIEIVKKLPEEARVYWESNGIIIT